MMNETITAAGDLVVPATAAEVVAAGPGVLDPTADSARVLTSVADLLDSRGRGLAGRQLGLSPTSRF